MPDPAPPPRDARHRATVGEVLREWGRIGCLGFGGPPAHIAMLRDLVVTRRRWMDAERFEDGVAVTNLLPGPASTQLAVFCAWSVRGLAGALVGAAAFIGPGLVAIIALAAVFLSSRPPSWVLGAGSGAGAAVAAVALRAGLDLVPPSAARARGVARARWVGYVLAGGLAAVLAGGWVVVALVACGAVELAVRAAPRAAASLVAPLAVASGGVPVGMAGLAWTALKVGALSYGGGFVIIPLMQADATGPGGWMTHAQFLDAVALGQVTPGPVVHTVAAVGYGADGLAGALVAAFVGFAPSVAFVLALAPRFDALRTNPRVRAFLDGAGPAAIGAILGVSVPLARALEQPWQFGVLGGAAVALLVLRRGVVLTLVAGAAVGVVLALAGVSMGR